MYKFTYCSGDVHSSHPTLPAGQSFGFCHRVFWRPLLVHVLRATEDMRRFLNITPTVRLHLASRSAKAPPPKKHGTVRDPLQVITNVSATTSGTTPSTTETDDLTARADDDVLVPDPKKPGLSPSVSDSDIKIPYFPRPFFRIRKIQEGSHGKTEAVRDINGGREGRDRVLCVKIFDQTVNSRAFEQELIAYMALSRATTRCGYNWLPFVMRLEASLEEPDRTFFVMVSF